MKLFTIFGNPVSHSISPLLHNSAITALNLDACYTRTMLKDSTKIIEKFKQLKLDGANVTVPHKEYAFKLCDTAKGISKKIGAVNTLIKDKNRIIGYNTDAPGFYESIKSFTNIKSALILGAGGTAKALSFILNDNGIKTSILNRSSSRLEFFIDNGFETFTHESFKTNKFDLIINTTPAGLNDENLPLKAELLNLLMCQSQYAFDVIYGRITPFIKLAKKHSLLYKDGSDMLLLQAVLAFNLFYKNGFDNKIIEKEMKKAFNL
ncbi:MAG: shikimate dehydrogenase [Sulfurospirillum sp.]